ncbi:MAG: DUF2271 domain-containing protein [Tannerellaceae bacterium]|nr:DUF2271 domain-containing protein [Tannerellaceae bacterium]
MKRFFLIGILILNMVAITEYGKGVNKKEMIIPEVSQDSFGRVEITFRFERHDLERSNQFAIWFQNQSGEVMRTLFVTKYAADGGYRIDLDCLPKWVNRAEPEFLPQAEIDAYTGPTPLTGRLEYVWDGKDRHGKPVPEGNYVYYIEGNMYDKSTIVYSGLILVSDEEMTVRSRFEQNEPFEYRGAGMIEDVVVRYIP